MGRLNKNDLIMCFQDTQDISYKVLKKKTQKAICNQVIYKEGFTAEKSDFRDETAEVIVEENTSFQAAREYRKYGRTAVLNFANPVNPGGGVTIGAMAQEECLCRSSNLYAALSNSNVFEDYYNYNKCVGNNFFSDRLIYTPGVTIFKSDDTLPVILEKSKWIDVDVITCAAPYIGGRKYTNKKALKELFRGRIKNIFEAALDNQVEVLILGAFGCGAFKNPPEIVAKAFCEVIAENEYIESFKKIVFAIKRTTVNGSCESCPNILAFEEELRRLREEYWGGRMIGNVIIKSNEFYRQDAAFCASILEPKDAFDCWKERNSYCGKQFSVLGDSMSTLEGYNPRGYNLFYTGENCQKANVYKMTDTWWGKVIDFFGGELLVNDSWSGSRVTRLPDSDRLFPSGCSNERTAGLHINAVMPDVILVYLGTNDWARGVETYDFHGNELSGVPEASFEFAYEDMTKKLKKNYPDAEIWCCTLNSTFISGNPFFSFPYEYGGRHIDEYNEIIARLAAENNCRLIDFNAYHWAYDSIDGSHPSLAGMNTLATMAIRQIGGGAVDEFLDCENNVHDYELVDPNGAYDFCRCIKCGKKMEISTCFGGSAVSYLILKSSGNVFAMKEPVISVGRWNECNLTMNPAYIHISRKHAIFVYEKDTSSWYVQDEHSTNGTWLNFQRLKPGVKYRLKSGDIIDFAHLERAIFMNVQSGVVKEFSISYGNDFRKSITYQDKQLVYRNIISPTIGYMKFPKGYFDEKVKNLSDGEVNEIIAFLKKCSYKNWASDEEPYILVPGRSCDIFQCTYEDGSSFEYDARCGNAGFKRFAAFLEKYCDFIVREAEQVPTDVSSVNTGIDKVILCRECNAKILFQSNYCPVCGKKVLDKTVDGGIFSEYSDQTLRSCIKCSHLNLFEHKYCYNCGETLR